MSLETFSSSDYAPESLSELFRTSRLRAGYRTVKAFYDAFCTHLVKKRLDVVSYPYYQQMEKGIRVPPIRLALLIGDFLRIPRRQVCFLFARAQMPDAETQAFFDVEDFTSFRPNEMAWASDETLNFDDEAARYFAKHPDAYEILIMAVTTTKNKLTDIAKALVLDRQLVLRLAKELEAMELVSLVNGQISATSKFVQIVGNYRNREVLWKIASRNLKAVHNRYYEQRRDYPAFRSSTSIPVPRDVAIKFLENLRMVSRHFDSLDDGPKDDTETYYLGILFGPRFDVRKEGSRDEKITSN